MVVVKQVRYEEVDGDIKEVDWEYSLTGYGTIGGTLVLPELNDNYIPIEEVTEEIILGWVNNLVNPTQYELQPDINQVQLNTIIY